MILEPILAKVVGPIVSPTIRSLSNHLQISSPIFSMRCIGDPTSIRDMIKLQ